jgi:hypothetical protein
MRERVMMDKNSTSRESTPKHKVTSFINLLLMIAIEGLIPFKVKCLVSK